MAAAGTAVERWGSLSVDDHIDPRGLVANVLLYDRLIIPAITEQADRDERAYWIARGWNPDLQAERIAQLDQLAVARPWDQQRRAMFRSRFEQLRAEQRDVDATDLTRKILAQEQVLEKPEETRVTVVAAYNSTKSIAQDFLVSAEDHLAAQACLLSRRLAIPDLKNPEDSLAEAIALSTNSDFRRKRSALFEWQELAVLKHWTPAQAVARLSEMTDDYNAAVKDAVGKVRWRFAFTISGIALGFLLGGPAGIVGAAASAGVTLIQFAKLDAKPAVAAGASAPVAMFHDIKTRLGLPLRSPAAKTGRK